MPPLLLHMFSPPGESFLEWLGRVYGDSLAEISDEVLAERFSEFQNRVATVPVAEVEQ